ncbi:phosphoribosyltransferase family protein [Kutzneria sp. 744]|uniref:phosphoribosyltransferase family protein n=1 Tax=Kutzneria sp. (strain 744) TaxID=345341 RepID=UPI0004BCDB2A|nr:phosphoribosyltransferase family protein [Kutzneria sp. 744]
MLFVNRADAGRRLAERLAYLRQQNVVVLGLPRGGVPVAYEVARALNAPLDVLVVRKLGLPYQPELAMGAIGEGGVGVLNDDVVRAAHVTDEELKAAANRERVELDSRVRHLRGDRPRLPLTGRTVVIVDDGIATGATARAACQVARAHHAARIIVAMPVGAPDTVESLSRVADEVVCLETPRNFYGVGQWYADFTQISDAEVASLLTAGATDSTLAAMTQQSDPPPVREKDITITADGAALAGRLAVPDRAEHLILFAHGSGSSRFSPRNRFVATALNHAGFATLLMDLLTPEEEWDQGHVFDIALLADRLEKATGRLRGEYARVGYFGASTGGAAALWAAAEPGADVAAVVSRGGRPDLAGDRLRLVAAPTLLIVGSRDEIVLDLNRGARAQLRCPSDLVVVSGATHLFEEPGALQRVADLARDWFSAHLARTSRSQLS